MNKVLIVEDDELIAELERDYLEAGGFEVELIFDGNEGLNRAMAGGWDALILDVMLPGKSGFEVCREEGNPCICRLSWSQPKKGM